jgi:hypothetical protein
MIIDNIYYYIINVYSYIDIAKEIVLESISTATATPDSGFLQPPFQKEETRCYGIVGIGSQINDSSEARPRPRCT